MKTNPFRELVNKLQQIRKEPLSKEQVEKINSVLEENKKDENGKDSFENDKRKIARPDNSANDGVEIQ
jgi:hypothetical protein